MTVSLEKRQKEFGQLQQCTRLQPGVITEVGKPKSHPWLVVQHENTVRTPEQTYCYRSCNEASPPLLVCAGGKSSAEGTEVPAVEPPDVSLICSPPAPGCHLLVSSSTCCLAGLHEVRRACMLFYKNLGHNRIRARC